MGKCTYYDEALGVCKLHSDWSEAMPVLQPCVKGACNDYMPIRNYDRLRDMSIEEMKEFLMEWAMSFALGKAPLNVKEWLESEVE